MVPRGNPIVARLDELEALVDEAASGNPVFLSIREKNEAVTRLFRLRDRIDGLAMAVVAVSEDVAAEHGARSSADWLAHATRSDYRSAVRSARLGEALVDRWHQLHDALLHGAVTSDQAEAIAAALGALPRDVDPEILDKAEAHLIEEATRHTPRQLRILGRKVLEVVAPETYDDHERRLLEAEEARARRRVFLNFRYNHDGTTDIHGRVPDSIVDRLRIYLESFTSPRQRPGDADPDPEPSWDPHADSHMGRERRRPYSERLGEAFCALLERIPAELLPQHGGSSTTMVVTIDYEQLRDGLGAAEISGGGRISAGEARRLACMATIIPAVLGGPSQVLDVGRASRLFTPAQRLAMTLRDQECRAEGCTIPATWCEAHHLERPWAAGGRTDLADGALLCSHHHHRAHDLGYQHQVLPNGQLRFQRLRR